MKQQPAIEIFKNTQNLVVFLALTNIQVLDSSQNQKSFDLSIITLPTATLQYHYHMQHPARSQSIIQGG